MTRKLAVKLVVHGLRAWLTLALLYVVWHHAHWSVALTLTLTAVNAEIMGWWMRFAGEDMSDLERWTGFRSDP